MRLNQYLLKQIDKLSRRRSKEIIDMDEMRMFFHKNYVEEDTLIYRGIEDVSDRAVYFVKPKEHTRVSRNTANYYTLLIDNSPRWSKYPKRSKSIICSTSRETADLYGKVFVVIPKKGSSIGICPDNDIWASFSKIDLANFGYVLNDIFNNTPNCIKNPNTIHELLKNFEIFDNYIKNISNNWSELDKFIKIDKTINSNFVSSLIDAILDENMKTIDFIEDTLDPEKNGFGLSKAGSFRIHGDYEVWTDGESMLIPLALYKRFVYYDI